MSFIQLKKKNVTALWVYVAPCRFKESEGRRCSHRAVVLLFSLSHKHRAMTVLCDECLLPESVRAGLCGYDNIINMQAVCMCVCLSQTDMTVYRTVLAHPVALCEIHSIELKNTGSRFYRQGDVHVKSVCVSEFPSLRYSTGATVWTHILSCSSSSWWVLFFCILETCKCLMGLFLLSCHIKRWTVQTGDETQFVSLLLVCSADWNTGAMEKWLEGHATKNCSAYQTLIAWRAKRWHSVWSCSSVEHGRIHNRYHWTWQAKRFWKCPQISPPA